MRVFLLALLLATATTAADPPPHVAVALSPKEGAWVGERVTFTVTLYTPDLFAGVPSFNIPSIPGVVVMPPTGSPTIGSERVGDASFTTQRHEFAIYAQRPGMVSIPAFTIDFETNAGFGKPVIKRQVTTEAASFAAKTPPGASRLGAVIAAHSLKVSDEWKPDATTLKVGDAITRTVTTTATDVPGMVLPPLRFATIDGVAAYPKEPVVKDRTERGTLSGERTESVTFICERPGTVTIPDRSLTWFDLDAKVLKTVQVPGRTFQVAANPKAASAQDSTPASTATARSHRAWWWMLLSIGVVVALGWLTWARLWPWWKRYRSDRTESESAYFARFRRACRSGEPHTIYVALLQWIDRLGPLTLDEFTSRGNDSRLADCVADLSNRVYTRERVGSDTWPASLELLSRAKATRRQIRTTVTPSDAAGSLPALNPSNSTWN